MINRIAPFGLILAIACGSDGVGPVPGPADISDMAVGEVRTYNPREIQNGIELPTSASARDYVIIVGNTNPAHDVVANYAIRADKAPGATFGISVPTDAAVATTIPLSLTRQQAFESRVRAFEKRNLTLQSSSTPFGSVRLPLRKSAQLAVAAIPAVGDRINLKVPDASTDNLLCSNFIRTQAVVASVSRRAILAVDTLNGPPSLLFTQAQMDSITAEFDNLTYPTDSSYFGDPTDVDANGGHIIMLFTGQVNKLTPPNSPSGTGFTVGFSFGGDFFPTTGTTPGSFCPQSNQAEIFYLLAPDPTGRFGNVRTASSVRQGTRGTIAHEFQHMINSGRRYSDPAVQHFESVWLDEALAHVGEDAVGRVQRGFADLQTLSISDVLPCNRPCSQANDFDAFFFQNLARLTLWMAEPNRYSPTSALADSNLATRGAGWAILRYAADNYANADPRAFTRRLVAGPDTGVKNFSNATQASVDTLVKGWLVSMYADHLGIPGLDAKYQYRSYNFPSVMPPVAQTVLNQPAPRFPLLVQSIGSGSDNIAGTNRSGTGTYYRLNVPANSGLKSVKVVVTPSRRWWADASGNPASFAGEHVYVLRVQ